MTYIKTMYLHKFQQFTFILQAVECAFPYNLPIDDLKTKLQETGLKQVMKN